MGENQAKKFSLLGDSVSTLFGYSRPMGAEFYSAVRLYETGVYDLADTWWGQVIAVLGGQLLVNNSYAGSTVCRSPYDEVGSSACSDRRTAAMGEDGEAPDVIFVFVGLNDCGLGVKLAPTCEAEKGDLTVFSEAYGAMLTKLKANYPRAVVWCLTLPQGLADGYAPTQAARERAAAYSRIIAACAAAHGCHVADICGMEPYDSRDGLHPTAEGMKQLAAAVLAALREAER